jgi:GABA(A) receptor-associated protein
MLSGILGELTKSTSTMSQSQPYQQVHTLEKRKAEAERIRQKYPDRIPVIVERHPKADTKDVPEIDKKKYLVPADIQLSQLLYIIRKRLHRQLKPEQALFVYLAKTQHLAPAHQLISATYKEHKDEDGFLYLQYASENTFGTF